MGQVVSLDAARRARALRASVADLAALHPATRWTVGASALAHRRDPRTGRTRCGIGGPLTIAPPRHPLCAACEAAA